jgi:hypothetical protein
MCIRLVVVLFCLVADMSLLLSFSTTEPSFFNIFIFSKLAKATLGEEMRSLRPLLVIPSFTMLPPSYFIKVVIRYSVFPFFRLKKSTLRTGWLM